MGITYYVLYNDNKLIKFDTLDNWTPRPATTETEYIKFFDTKDELREWLNMYEEYQFFVANPDIGMEFHSQVRQLVKRIEAPDLARKLTEKIKLPKKHTHK